MAFASDVAWRLLESINQHPLVFVKLYSVLGLVNTHEKRWSEIDSVDFVKKLLLLFERHLSNLNLKDLGLNSRTLDVIKANLSVAIHLSVHLMKANQIKRYRLLK